MDVWFFRKNVVSQHKLYIKIYIQNFFTIYIFNWFNPQILKLKWNHKQVYDLLVSFLSLTESTWTFFLNWFYKFLELWNKNHNTWNMNKWLTKSKTFSISTVKRKPLNFKVFVTFDISKINRPCSYINLCF